MDTAIMVEGKAWRGYYLVEALEKQSNINIAIAMWIELEEIGWVLLLVTDDFVGENTTTGVLEYLYDVIERKRLGLSLADIYVTDTSSSIYKSIRDLAEQMKLRVDFSSNSPYPIYKEFMGRYVNGHPFPNSLIYKFKIPHTDHVRYQL